MENLNQQELEKKNLSIANENEDLAGNTDNKPVEGDNSGNEPENAPVTTTAENNQPVELHEDAPDDMPNEPVNDGIVDVGYNDAGKEDDLIRGTVDADENQETPEAKSELDNVESNENAPDSVTETAHTESNSAPLDQTTEITTEQPAEQVIETAEDNASVNKETANETADIASDDLDDFSDDTEKEALAYEVGVAQDDETADYSTLGKEELVALAIKASQQEDLKEASVILRNIRPVLESVFAEEHNAALNTFIEEGNEKENFAPQPDELKQQFFDAFKELQRRRAEERKKLEQDKQKNLAVKREILEKLKHLTETDETQTSLEHVKELQREWKRVRNVPPEFVQELWDSYRFYLDKFYDNVSINNELKELDRKKNLETKIELVKKVSELSEEKSIKKGLILLNKYHEDWKNVGPVPNEFSDEIWKRFKEASDKVYEQKKGEMAKMQEIRLQNLELKTAICEKLELLTATEPEKPKEWIEKTKEVNNLFEEWKKVGKVPHEHNEVIWNRFRELKNKFYNDKNAFFRTLNGEKTENMRLKLEICEKAEALKESTDWQKAGNELKRLQDEWKKIGPVHDKNSDGVWKRFRAACDAFFNRKDEHFKDQKNEQAENLQKKTDILARLEALVSGDTEVDVAFGAVKQIQKEWSEIGFVPMGNKNEIQNRFSDAIDKLYKKLKRNPEEMSEARLKEHYEEISTLPDAGTRLKNEERRVREKIKFLKTDIETWENNMGFFSGNSKNKNPFIQQIEDKISKANGQLERLNRELKVLRSFDQGNS